MKLKGRTAIITGGGSGIGAATAMEFSKEGAQVTVADINRETGSHTVAKIRESGGDAIFQFVDTACYESVQKLVDQTISYYGKLDVMFNNAGVGHKKFNVLDMPIEEYHRNIDINQHGVFYGIKAAGNAMKERGGVIINTASIYAFIADRRRLPYHASKGAVVMMTKSAALDLAKYNIRVVGIAPGLIETGIVEQVKQDPRLWEIFSKSQMRRKAGKPEEVAKVVKFLASDDASFVNGSILFVDDGAASYK